MIFIWLLAGCVVVALAFLMPGNSVDPWPPLNAAGIAAAVYLAALFAYTLRPPVPQRRRVITIGLSVVVLAGIAVGWLGIRDTTNYQRRTLLKIHGVIMRGIMQAQTSEYLDVVQRFHAQKAAKKLTLAEVFKQKYPNAAVGNNVYTPCDTWDSLRVFIAAMSDTEITLLMHHPYSRGRDEKFVSYTGRKGSVQEHLILTEKGLRHESDN